MRVGAKILSFFAEACERVSAEDDSHMGPVPKEGRLRFCDVLIRGGSMTSEVV
jgi:hypothetical protein